MTLPEENPTSSTEERTRPSRAQRRRAQRKTMPISVDGRSALLQHLVQRAYPSYEFFLFAAFCGAILGVGYILDAQAFLLFGILLAPLMSPWVGVTLAIVSGKARFLVQSLGALLVGSLIVFLTGALAGLAARIWLPLTLTEAFTHSRLWWTDLVALALGAMLLAASFVRSEKKPFLPSVIVAYELFLPLSAAAFGLGSGVGDMYPQGLQVFAIHLAWATLFGALTLFVLGFRPTNTRGKLVSGGILFLGTVVFLTVSGMGRNILQTGGIMPTSTPKPIIATQTDVAPAADVIPSATVGIPSSSTPKADVSTATPSRTPTLHITLTPTSTATPTLTAEPTPIYARIDASRGGGAYVRREPDGPVILTVANGDLVQVLSEPIVQDGVTWVHIRVVRDTKSLDGWIIQSVLLTATPAPGW